MLPITLDEGHAIDDDGAVGIACVQVALGSCVRRAPVGPDQRLQHLVASVHLCSRARFNILTAGLWFLQKWAVVCAVLQ